MSFPTHFPFSWPRGNTVWKQTGTSKCRRSAGWGALALTVQLCTNNSPSLSIAVVRCKMRMDGLSLRCSPAMKCYDSNYSENWAPNPQSFLESVVATARTEAALSWSGVAGRGSWWGLTLVVCPITERCGPPRQRRHRERNFDSPPVPNQAVSRRLRWPPESLGRRPAQPIPDLKAEIWEKSSNLFG